MLNKLGPILGLALVFALFAILRPKTFLTVDNMQIMLLQTAVVATAALGMTVIIISGGIDLSVGSQIALATVVIAQLLSMNYSPLIAVAGGIASACACGVLIGLGVTLLRLPPFIMTLGLWGAIRGAAKWSASETEIYPPLDAHRWLANLMGQLGPKNPGFLLPNGVWVMFALTLLVAAVLRYTRFGRHVFAIGSNEQTARLCGVRVSRAKVLIYLFGALFAGVAGLLQFSYLRLGDPTTATGYELDVIAAVVIGGASLNGGQGGVFGSLIGALIMTVVNNGCTKVGLPNSRQEVVTGAIIIAACAIDQLRQRKPS
jgi:ribose/xylose/arabinose/galactoside ABC-type transport system permease subunit